MSIHYGKTPSSFINFIGKVEVSDASLIAQVNIPAPPKGLIIIPKVSSTSTSNLKLCSTLLKNRYGVIVANLLSVHEQAILTIANNLNLLAERLIELTKWVNRIFVQEDIKLGYFGESEAGLVAIKASTYLDDHIKAIVCKDGKVDLVKNDFQKLHSPVLLMVDKREKEIVSMNHHAFSQLHSVDKLLLIEDNKFLNQQECTERELKESIDWIDKYVGSEEFVLA
jgi:putative phosphoribosyl transferase